MEDLNNKLQTTGQNSGLTNVPDNGVTCLSLQGVLAARAETAVVLRADPQELVTTIMRISTMVGAPPPSGLEYGILKQEILASIDINNLSTGELVLAYRLAITGRLDTPQTDLITYGNPLNLFTITKVIQSYRRWVLNQRHLNEEPLPAYSPDYSSRVAIMIQGAIRAWEAWSATGRVEDWGNAVHSFLYVNGFISRDKEEIEALHREAVEIYRRELNTSTLSQNIQGIREINKIMRDMDGGNYIKSEGKLKSIRRRLSLQHYFEELEFAGTPLPEVLRAKQLSEYKLSNTKSDENTK